MHGSNIEENKREMGLHTSCDAPAFKRILRMGIPTQRGRGGGKPLLFGLVVNPKSRATGAKLQGPDIFSTDTSSQTLFKK